LKSLAISVPTYNRAELLDFFLLTHAPYFYRHGIPIYIVDNASDDETEEICRKWASNYSNVRQYRFANHLEPDQNFHRALTIPKEDFVWLVGDGYEISEPMLIKVLNTLNSATLAVDHITTNLVSLSKQLHQHIFVSRAEFVKSLPWLISCISCNIYSRKLINGANFGKFYGSNWLQLGIVLDYFERFETRVLFLPQVSVVTLKCPSVKKSGWGGSYFEICFDKFPALVFSLGSDYTVDEKLDILDCFYRKTPLFKFRHLLNIRAQGFLRWPELRKYLRKLKSFAPLRFLFLTLIIASIPRPIAFAFAKAIEISRKWNYRVLRSCGLWKDGY